MSQTSGELQAVERAVRDYLDGMIFANPDQLRRAFHPKANVIGHWEGSLEWSSLEEFIAACEKAGAAPANEPYYWEILSTDVAGDIALVKLADDYFGVRFTDYLTLLNDGMRWQIVNKTFYAQV
ncbi:MAG: nuclear transport factor 2 family protein [Rhizobiaceae bacterium]|nr:nuclear transport factor 2 family protein [Rhizobiaceae bacterium]